LVQSVLFFALGVLCAAFLVVLIAPSVWRRAVVLTRRRVEASIPQTQAEIQADKDRIRAEYAMTTRRLEISVKSLKEKVAEQLVEISRGREALKGLAMVRQDKNQALSELEVRNEMLREREEQLQRLHERLTENERKLDKRALDLEKLEQMYDDASFASSNRQIELVARESELQKLADDITALRTQRKEAEKRSQEAATEIKLAREALKAEKKKTGELEKKLERLTATLAEREDKLARREKELERSRAERPKSVADNAPALRLVAQEPPHRNGAADESIEKAIARLDGDRERLENKLSALARENKRLKTSQAAFEAAPGEAARQTSAALREQMNELAAEVVNLTARLEGPDSPIAKALAASQEARPAGDRAVSLADRVRALQKVTTAD
jgi:chromosome segregation ATPase